MKGYFKEINITTQITMEIWKANNEKYFLKKKFFLEKAKEMKHMKRVRKYIKSNKLRKRRNIES